MMYFKLSKENIKKYMYYFQSGETNRPQRRVNKLPNQYGFHTLKLLLGLLRYHCKNSLKIGNITVIPKH